MVKVANPVVLPDEIFQSDSCGHRIMDVDLISPVMLQSAVIADGSISVYAGTGLLPAPGFPFFRQGLNLPRMYASTSHLED